MLRRALLVLALPAVVTATAFAAVLPPKAETGAATDVGHDRATLTATVDPHGGATTVRFDLGTPTGYGVQSPPKDVPAGEGDVAVQIPVGGLAASTTYHFRVTATSEGGTTTGGDRTFRTGAAPPAPARPSVGTSSALSVTSTAATLSASVDPNRQATTYRFEYGTSSSYGQITDPVDAGSGDRAIAARTRIAGLQPGTRYHYRVLATNATGTSRGAGRSFTTTSSPTAASLEAVSDRVTYGASATVRGHLTGPRVTGVRVVLQTTAHPFGNPFADALKPVTSGSGGSYSFTLPALTQTTRAIVIADGRLLSPVVTLRSAARVGILGLRREGSRIIVRGRVRPATPDGTVSVQRRSPSGRFSRVARARVGTDGIYEASISSTRRMSTIRVVGLPRDGGAHVPGTSRELRVAGRR